MAFPEKFVWGAAAASYQIEGAAYADGKGLSVWDTFCKVPGKVWGGHTGEVACDHYHRWREDLDIMAGIGLKAYRLSISWPRVMPAGTGKVNAKGLAFYDRLIDGLLERGIQPWVTLFHWDYPYELYKRGGWLNRESSDWFARYAEVIVNKLSDRVHHWMTLNEPQCFINLGHATGDHAPGLKLGLTDVIVAGHNSLLAHGKACQAIRAGKTKAMIGAAPVGSIRIPASESRADIEAARKHMFELRDKGIWSLAWFSDPMILGHYPKDHLELMKDEVPDFPAGDMKIIRQKLDFYGTNIYQGHVVKAGANGAKPSIVELDPGYPMTSMEWNLSPDALYWGSRLLYERYKLPLVVTENGMAGHDWVHLDGRVPDAHRIDYLKRYLGAFRRASEDGIPCLGYFYWSIMDNFEWAQGYKRRFGLVHVDYKTLKRTPKESAAWYGEVIRTNGKNF